MLLSYKDVEKELLKTIDKNDSDKEYKILEINRWSKSYRYILDRYGIGTTLPFFMAILSDKECWNGRNLDRKKIGRKLLEPNAKDANGHEVKNYMDNFSRYQISCWCCFEEYASKLFDQFKDKRESFNRLSAGEPLPLTQSIEMNKFIKSLSSGKGALTIFWSYHFGNVDIRSEENKNMDINEYGLECAMAEQFVEAISFFWDKLPEEKKNLDTLMKISLYDSITGSATSDMIRFCLNEIKNNKDLFKFDNYEEIYKTFLKKDYEKNGYYSTLNVLIDDKLFESAKRLFLYIDKEHMTGKNYESFMYGILNKLSLLSNNSHFSKLAEDVLNTAWNNVDKHHKKNFLDNMYSQFSPTRDYIVQIINQKKSTELLIDIIDSIDKKKLKDLSKVNIEDYSTLVNSLKHLMSSIKEEPSLISLTYKNPIEFRQQLFRVVSAIEDPRVKTELFTSV